MIKAGILAIQGSFELHDQALRRCGLTSDDISFVRTEPELDKVERLIIPGGESTTVGLLLRRHGLGDVIRARVLAGMPIWGTCMGMIMMAHDIEDRQQYSLDLLDITIRRNAFGAQVHSFEDEVKIEGIDTPVTGIFIRAPIVTRTGPNTSVLGSYHGSIVAVKQGNRIGTSFHPELTDDIRIHQMFLGLEPGLS